MINVKIESSSKQRQLQNCAI